MMLLWSVTVGSHGVRSLCRRCSVQSVFPRETNLTLGIYNHNKNFNELEAHQITAAGAEQIFTSFKLSIIPFFLLLFMLLLLLVS